MVVMTDTTDSNSPAADNPALEVVRNLSNVEPLSASDLLQVESIGTKADTIALPQALTEEKEQDPIKAINSDDEDIRQKLGRASIPEKIKYALFGNGFVRSALIKDANKIIQQCVLKNPRITPIEIEEFARSPHVSEFVIRSISNSAQWMKSYSLKNALVNNPKTPGDIALKWLRYLNEGEIKKIARSKQVPSLISTTAKKRLIDMGKK